MKKRVIITGGSGFIGTALSWALLQQNFDVVVLDVVPPKSQRVMFVEADMAGGIPTHHYLEKPTYIINLAGTPIFGRWTTEKKEDIYNSRICSTEKIIDLITNPLYRPEALISASATGFYGDAGTATLTERSSGGDGFLARVVADWEKAALEAEKLGVRTTLIRNANVIGSGGLYKVLRPFIKLHLVPQIGNTQACFPWIHLDDLVNIYVQSMTEPQAPNIINAVSPQISTAGEFYRELATASNSKLIHIPQKFVSLLFGDFARELSYSQCVRSEAISSRYKFKYPTLVSAIKNVISL